MPETSMYVKICEGLYIPCYIEEVSEEGVICHFRYSGRLIARIKGKNARCFLQSNVGASLQRADRLTLETLKGKEYVFYTLDENYEAVRVDDPVAIDLESGVRHAQAGVEEERSGKLLLRIAREDADKLPSVFESEIRVVE